MHYTIFKPNAKSTGGLGSFRVAQTKKGDDWVAQLFIELVPQSGWDAAKRVGSFDNSKKKCIMLNAGEAGEMINSINKRVEWKSFHKSGDTSTQISFGPWEQTMVLSVNSDGKQNRIGATIGELECLKILLEHFIKTSLSLSAKNNDRKFKESQDGK